VKSWQLPPKREPSGNVFGGDSKTETLMGTFESQEIKRKILKEVRDLTRDVFGINHEKGKLWATLQR